MRYFDQTNLLDCAILGGGCFWCLEAIYQHIRGVEMVESGYAGGKIAYPSYQEVCTGETGHAEVVKVLFSEAHLSYRTLLEIFFALHDPTTLNRQGSDIGSQYRSIVFATTLEQLKIAQAVKNTLVQTQTYADPIVTEIYYLDKKEVVNFFWPAEMMHRNYYRDNQSRNPYCSLVIQPKLDKVKEKFAQYWQ